MNEHLDYDGLRVAGPIGNPRDIDLGIAGGTRNRQVSQGTLAGRHPPSWRSAPPAPSSSTSTSTN
jgi:hypothetical protein